MGSGVGPFPAWSRGQRRVRVECGAHLAAQRRPRAVGEARVKLVLRVEPLLRARARPRRRVLLDPPHDEADARRLALLAAKNRAAAVVVVAAIVVAAVVVVAVVVPARRAAHHAAEAEALLVVVAVAEDPLRQQVLERGWPRVRRAARHLAKPLQHAGERRGGGMSTQREGQKQKHLKGGAEAPAARRL